MSTKAILDHHNETFGNQDLEGVLEDYDEDSVIISHTGTFRGLDDIRGMFEAFFDELGHADATFTIRSEVVESDIAYITWEAESPENRYEFGTDTFVVEDDVIRYQTWGVKAVPK